MTKHIILFLAANPLGTDRLALDEEARAIEEELERSGHRNKFELVTRWAARPLDLLRELRKLKPTVVHFSGHGGRGERGESRSGAGARRDVVAESGAVDGDHRPGLFFQGSDGRPQLVSTAALEETFGAAGSSVKLVVLNACYSEVQAEALLAHTGCVVGMSGSIRDDAARNFAIGFYGGLGGRESIAAAYKQGRAAIGLEGLSDGNKPQLKVRNGLDAERLVLTASDGSVGVRVSTAAKQVSVYVSMGVLVVIAGAISLIYRCDELNVMVTPANDANDAVANVNDANGVASHVSTNPMETTARQHKPKKPAEITVDDVVVTHDLGNVIFELKIRNIGEMSAYVTRAEIKILKRESISAGPPEMMLPQIEKPTGEYKIQLGEKTEEKTYITSIDDSTLKLVNLNQVLSADSVDDFLIRATGAKRTIWEVALSLVYNGTQRTVPKILKFNT